MGMNMKTCRVSEVRCCLHQFSGLSVFRRNGLAPDELPHREPEAHTQEIRRTPPTEASDVRFWENMSCASIVSAILFTGGVSIAQAQGNRGILAAAIIGLAGSLATMFGAAEKSYRNRERRREWDRPVRVYRDDGPYENDD